MSDKLCKMTKDPCKICLQTVTPRTGVHCQGACESWVHFRCLNYTPGKIMDIKKGLITVTCPCSDCKTTMPKEYNSDMPFSCTNIMCPANNPPSCEQFDCQANELSRCMPGRCPPPGTLRSCAKDVCRKFSSSEPFDECAYGLDPCMQGYTAKTHCGDQKNERQCQSSVQTPCRGSSSTDLTDDVMNQMCKTVGDLAEQLNFLLDNMQSGKNGKSGKYSR